MGQIRAASRSPRGYRWTNSNKEWALSLLHFSQRAYYKVAEANICTTSLRTLWEVMEKVEVYPGFSQPILKALHLKTENLPYKEKTNMPCHGQNGYKSRIVLRCKEGRNGGTGHERKLFNHALDFLAKSLASHWKQSFGFFFSCDPISATRLNNLEIGLTVKVVVSDRGTNNSLVQKIHIHPEKPVFTHQHLKICVFYELNGLTVSSGARLVGLLECIS